MNEYERPYHQLAQLFPMLDGDDYEQFKQDIKQQGQLQPIILHPDGSILDGRNRHRACLDLGINPTFKTWDGVGSLVTYVISLNLYRRHLTSSQKAAIALEILPTLEAEARERQEAGNNQHRVVAILPQGSLGKSRDHAAKITQTSARYIQDAKRIREESPELFEQVKSGSVTIPQAKKKIQRQEKEDRKAAIPDDLPTENERYRLICSDALDMTRHVEPGSVDHIITDPPYPKDYLPVYEDLARFAAHALKPGGNLLVMVGQSYLPEILQLMTPHIQYHWTLAYLTPGGQSPQIWQRKVNTFWKPVLWFVKGDYTGDWIGDVAKSDPNHNDKRFHHWGQSESGMADLIERLTYPGQTICDPFLGGGTTAIVSVAMNRLFIGSDVDNDAIKITLERLQDGGNRINARHVSCL